MDVAKLYKEKYYPVKGSNKTMFFFPAGLTKMWQYKLTIAQINKMGISVIGYDIQWKKSIGSMNVDDSIAFVKSVGESVGRHITEAPEKSYSVFGTSYGSVLALYAAKQFKQINSVILNVPHGNVAEVFWSYKPAKKYIERLIASGIANSEELHVLFKEIEATTELGRLRGKNIIVFKSLNDKIVPNSQDIIDGLHAENIDLKVFTTTRGHFFSAIENLLKKSKWQNVLH
jgi:hypothetical protein